VFDPALNGALLAPSGTSNPYRSGWFETHMIRQLDWNLNSQLWDERWQLPEAAKSLAQHSLGNVIKQIDCDLKLVKVWADHRASAMANLVRGSFIVCALLGSLAVFSALAGLLHPRLSKPGKIAEILCLIVILAFIRRSTKWNWRAQWLSLRQFERSIEQAAWLLTLGRTIALTIPAHEHGFQDDQHSVWVNWYRRAVLRKAGFPDAKLDTDYINTVQELALQNLIRNQINYFESEASLYNEADERLETCINWCIAIAFVITISYLATSLLLPLALRSTSTPELMALLQQLESGVTSSGALLATFFGALMPAIAAAFAALRSHGEYAPIAARYLGTSRALQRLERQVIRTFPDRRRNRTVKSATSAEVSEQIVAATSSLFQEVIGWQSVLTKKKIEPI